MLGKLVPILVLISTPALAVDQAYLGAWAPDPAKCNFSGSGPFRITAKGIEGHEFTCTTKRTTSDSAGLLMNLSCADEGNTYDLTLRWKIMPNGHLRETTKEKVVEYVRCKPDDEAGGPQATQAMHHDEAGTVTYQGQLGGSSGEKFSLKIGPMHEGKSWVAVYVGAHGCLGDMAGQAMVRGDVLELTKDDGGNDCGLTIHRSATGATIAESNCVLDHGLSCSFDTQGKTLHGVK